MSDLTFFVNPFCEKCMNKFSCDKIWSNKKEHSSNNLSIEIVWSSYWWKYARFNLEGLFIQQSKKWTFLVFVAQYLPVMGNCSSLILLWKALLSSSILLLSFYGCYFRLVVIFAFNCIATGLIIPLPLRIDSTSCWVVYLVSLRPGLSLSTHHSTGNSNYCMVNVVLLSEKHTDIPADQ